MPTDKYCGKCDRYYSVENHQCLIADVIARARKAEAEVERLRTIIADDALAITFQTMGQYRWALLKTIAAGRGEEER